MTPDEAFALAALGDPITYAAPASEWLLAAKAAVAAAISFSGAAVAPLPMTTSGSSSSSSNSSDTSGPGVTGDENSTETDFTMGEEEQVAPILN